MWRAWKMTELHTGISRKSLKEKTRLGDLGIEDRITLKYILNNQEVTAWNGILEAREAYVPAPKSIEPSFRFHRNRDSSVGITTRYGLDGPGIESP